MEAEFGMLDYPLSLKAGVWQRQDVNGDYFLIVEATGPVKLRFDDSDIIQRRVAQGMPVRFYKKVSIMSETDQDVLIALGYTGGGLVPLDGRATLDGDVNVTFAKPTLRQSPDDVVIAAGASVQLLGVDADRLNAMVQLDEAAAGPIRVGDSAVDGTHGLVVQPDDAVECGGSPAVWAHNPNGVAVTVHLDVELAP
ncbi:hypothetical protein C3942_16895 [Solimonas fluminis]|uniref:Uncharacterized protein n=1 Tax=Solimonas fluminis TaxID=2086571 RepID=A0A2S5TCP3_9GAMM|nr:hypothetical protein [Solimonas fluminis]PPE72726.1 hypothetical protein C3942_16895 [Solimonas fluminis]